MPYLPPQDRFQMQMLSMEEFVNKDKLCAFQIPYTGLNENLKSIAG